MLRLFAICRGFILDDHDRAVRHTLGDGALEAIGPGRGAPAAEGEEAGEGLAAEGFAATPEVPVVAAAALCM